MASLPGIGHKTALRLVLHLLRQPEGDVEAFSDAFLRLRKDVKYCRICHNISDTDTCPICASPRRDHYLICVVENVQDVMLIERTGQYNGLYHVLGGIISPMDGVGPQDLEVESLVNRVGALLADASASVEVILALPTTMEGDTTNFYLYRRLTTALTATASSSLTVSQIARGIAVGNELEYTDDITLGRSILNRTPYKNA